MRVFLASRPSRAVVLTVLVISALQLVLPSSASADNGFHAYSKAWESTPYSGRYSGLNVYRLDRTVFGQPQTGCLNYYAGDPVYQTQWVLITADQANWLELGTGHQCEDAMRYWFWGYGYAGSWYPLGQTSGIADEVSHNFQIERNVYGYYVFAVDGSTKGAQGSSQASLLMTGLESYASKAVVGAYTHSNLWFLADTGTTWYAWSGRDGKQIDYPPMCGRWLTDSSWSLAEAQGC